MKKNLLATLGISLAALCAPLLTSCDSGNSASANSQDENSLIPASVTDTLAYAELYYNYLILDIYYYDAHLKNELSDDVNTYYGVGLSNGYTKGACTQRYIDVCSMYSQLSDKFTRYYDPNYAQSIYEQLTETDDVVGIGAEVTVETDSTGNHIVISEVYPGAPADQMGLMAGDTVVDVDGTAPSTVEAFEKLTSGTSGETVKITINRNGEKTTYVVALAAYNAPSVHLTYSDSIPVIKIDEFVETSTSDSGSYGEFMTILQKVIDRGAKSAVIDLRQNPGGISSQCANIASEMLEKGDTLFVDYMTDVDSSTGEYRQAFDTSAVIATTSGVGKDLYYVFLADTLSASCSEYMLAAVTSNRKLPIVGTVTYGKGIGQAFAASYAGGAMVITMEHSTDKNGETWHKVGFTPDYEISDTDEQLAKAVELAKGMKEKRTAGYGTVSTGHFDKTNGEIDASELPIKGGYYKFLNEDVFRNKFAKKPTP